MKASNNLPTSELVKLLKRVETLKKFIAKEAKGKNPALSLEETKLLLRRISDLTNEITEELTQRDFKDLSTVGLCEAVKTFVALKPKTLKGDRR